LPEEKMTRLRHSQLRSFVEIHLCQTRKLERGFLDQYEQLQDLREYANYNFGSKAPKYEYPQMKQVIEVVAESTLLQTREVLVTELQARDQLFEFQAVIGDNIGDDLIKLHSGPLVTKQVWDYLLRSSLTT
jgi:pyruvate-formate lyase